uniref:CCHC-type domain-containing protein n=1 Tax=Cacopsylla melanoneura TaxID=428564 RepID=A0A8D8LE45_9HEMI
MSKGKMMGNIVPLDLQEATNVSSWLEQFEIYSNLNNVNKDKKVLLFLSSLTTETYNAVRELCLPESPASKDYEFLTTTLSEFVNPPPNFLMERFKLKDRRQLQEENVGMFAKNLRKMAEHCKFDLELDNYLRDQFIWGLRDESMQRKLLSEGGDKNFNKCVEIAVSMEATSKNVMKLNQGMHLVRNVGPVKGKQFQPKCFCCGETGHVRPSCKFKNYQYKNGSGPMNKKGHSMTLKQLSCQKSFYHIMIPTFN